MKIFKKFIKVDCLPLIILIAFWLFLVFSHRAFGQLSPGDFQRDTAITYNILSGNVLGDATYIGERQWYPFLYHSIYAFYQKLTGLTVEKLYLSYPFLLSIPVVGIFVFCVSKIFKSPIFTFVSLFSAFFCFFFTRAVLNVVTHPFVLAFGTIYLAIYFFWRAITLEKMKDYLIAGIGVSLVVLSQPFFAMTLGGGIALYQLATRKNWRKFLSMVGISFVIASPYLLPLIIYYKLTPVNTLNYSFAPYDMNLDNFFYGLGNIRWLNLFFISSGVVIAFLRRSKIDKLLLSLFFFGLTIIVFGFLTSSVKLGLLGGLKLPSSFVWQDLMVGNQTIVVLFFAIGVTYFMKELSKFKQWNKIKINPKYLLLIAFILPYSLLMVPRYHKLINSWYKSQTIFFPYDKDWQSAVLWIRSNTSINDVFLASSGPSYLFVSGLTGRKVIMTDKWHSNPFVNQEKREIDDWTLLTTTNMENYLTLAKKYQVSYVIVSPYELMISVNGMKKFEDEKYFDLVYSVGEIKLYKAKQI